MKRPINLMLIIAPAILIFGNTKYDVITFVLCLVAIGICCWSLMGRPT